MEAMKTQSVPNLAYEDVDPDFQWERDESAATATLVVLLPGFRREQFKVQITSAPLVKIIGERQINGNKRRRINKEFSIPSDCNPDEATAKFERGRLYIRFSIKASSKPQQEDSSKPTKDKAEEEKTKRNNEVSEQKETPQNQKDQAPPKEEGKREEKKKVTTSGVVEGISEGSSSKDGENLGLIKRTKTRVLDYTISLKPTYDSEDLKKPKKLANLILVILSLVVLGIYVKNAFRSFLGGESKF